MKNLHWIIILVLVSLLFLQRECSRTETIVLDRPIFIFDTDTITQIIEPEPIETIVPGDTIYTIDTVFINDGSLSTHIWDIIADYYSRKFYEEILIDDDQAYLKVNVELFNNDISDLGYYFVNKRPVDIICPEVPKIRNKLFVGGQILGSPAQFGAGPSVAWLTKQENLYTYQWDAINNTHGISMYWKLSFRR